MARCSGRLQNSAIRRKERVGNEQRRLPMGDKSKKDKDKHNKQKQSKQAQVAQQKQSKQVKAV